MFTVYIGIKNLPSDFLDSTFKISKNRKGEHGKEKEVDKIEIKTPKQFSMDGLMEFAVKMNGDISKNSNFQKR